jgi:phosphohistidine phosphatase
MKKLYVIRHAKSSWAEPDMADFERPLNERGKTDAPMMGKRLKKAKIHPDLIISSPAKRALKTAKIIAKELDFPKEQIVTDGAIYPGGVSGLLDVIHSLHDSFQTVILVGHNPGLTDLANYLTDVQIDNIPTCGVFCVDFEIQSWKKVGEGNGICVLFDYPKNEEK